MKVPRRYLTIDDYSDPIRAYVDCLAQLKSLHDNFVSNGASKGEKKWEK